MSPHSIVPRQAPSPTRANLGPLTTLFVAPSHCSRVAIGGSVGETGGIRGQSCAQNGATTDVNDTGCWPRATAYPTSAGKEPLNGLGFYSPAVMCPTGWTSACTSVSATAGQSTSPPRITGNFQFPLQAGETGVGCCPMGYTCAMNGGIQRCHQQATSTEFAAMSCNGRQVDMAVTVPFTTGPTTIATMNLWAPMIQMIHMASDIPPGQQGVAGGDGPAPAGVPVATAAPVPNGTPNGIPNGPGVNPPSGPGPNTQPNGPNSNGAPGGGGSDGQRNGPGSNPSDGSPSATNSNGSPAETGTNDIPGAAGPNGAPGQTVIPALPTETSSEGAAPSATSSQAAAPERANNAKPPALPQEQEPDDGNMTGLSVGLALGSFFTALTLIALIWYFRRKKRNPYPPASYVGKASTTSSQETMVRNPYGGNNAVPTFSNPFLAPAGGVTATTTVTATSTPYNGGGAPRNFSDHGPGPMVSANPYVYGREEARAMAPIDEETGYNGASSYPPDSNYNPHNIHPGYRAHSTSTDPAYFVSPVDGRRRSSAYTPLQR